MKQGSYSNFLIRQANESYTRYKTSLFVGESQMVPQMVGDLLRADKVDGPVLDYGSGKHADHARSMQERGFDVYAHDIGDNFKSGVHRRNALGHSYALVYACSVLNVQGSKEMLDQTLQELRSAVWEGGLLICNLPLSPRYAAWDGPAGRDAQILHNKLRELFGEVEMSGGASNSPVFNCRNVDRPILSRIQKPRIG